jgi:hypothetical protein
MRSGGSASLSVVRRAGRPARRSAPRPGTTPATAVVAVAGIPPAVTAGVAPILQAADMAAGRTPPVVGDIPQAHARCTRRSAPNAGGTRKSRSSPARTSRSTAESASSCDGRRCLRATTTTSSRKEEAHEGGGREATPFRRSRVPLACDVSNRGRDPFGVLLQPMGFARDDAWASSMVPGATLRLSSGIGTEAQRREFD